MLLRLRISGGSREEVLVRLDPSLAPDPEPVIFSSSVAGIARIALEAPYFWWWRLGRRGLWGNAIVSDDISFLLDG